MKKYKIVYKTSNYPKSSSVVRRACNIEATSASAALKRFRQTHRSKHIFGVQVID